MVWLNGSQTELTCDVDSHRGPKVFRMVHGTTVSADDAARATGWKRHKPTGAFICPECVKRVKALSN